MLVISSHGARHCRGTFAACASRRRVLDVGAGRQVALTPDFPQGYRALTVMVQVPSESTLR